MLYLSTLNIKKVRIFMSLNLLEKAIHKIIINKLEEGMSPTKGYLTVAKEMGMSHMTIRKLDSGSFNRCDFETIERAAAYFGLSAEIRIKKKEGF